MYRIYERMNSTEKNEFENQIDKLSQNMAGKNKEIKNVFKTIHKVDSRRPTAENGAPEENRDEILEEVRKINFL